MLCGHNKRKKKKNQSKGAATFMLKAVFNCTQLQPFLLASRHLLSCIDQIRHKEKLVTDLRVEINLAWQIAVHVTCLHVYQQPFGVFIIFYLIWDSYKSFHLCKVYRTICMCHIFMHIVRQTLHMQKYL